MPKVLFDRDDKERRLIFCQACGHGHLFDSRWTFNGDVEKPTFNPSMLVSYDHGDGTPKFVCHSFVREGNIEYLNDCTHEYAGKTIPLTEAEY